jgi:hypothetical protein
MGLRHVLVLSNFPFTIDLTARQINGAQIILGAGKNLPSKSEVSSGEFDRQVRVDRARPSRYSCGGI